MTEDLVLHGKNEFCPELNYKKYFIYKIITKQKEEYMVNIFNQFIKNKSKQKFLGIDFEFNKVSKTDREVSLMQINLEDDRDIGYIMIFNPHKINKESIKVLIELLTAENMIKILHGAEALDVPYLFNQLLVTKELIDLFCVNFYDTKYLCDYDNINIDEKKKCGIYHLLMNNEIINKDILEKLEKIEEKIGPMYLVTIDIYDMSDEIFKYSLYDVIYLPQLIKVYLAKNKDNHVYTKIIPEISAIVNKYKRNVENEFNELQVLVHSHNLNYIVHEDTKYFLKDIWELFYITLSNPLQQIKEINYFKQFIEIMTKFYVYYHTSYSNKLNYQHYQNWLKQYKFTFELFNQFEIIVKSI